MDFPPKGTLASRQVLRTEVTHQKPHVIPLSDEIGGLSRSRNQVKPSGDGGDYFDLKKKTEQLEGTITMVYKYEFLALALLSSHCIFHVHPPLLMQPSMYKQQEDKVNRLQREVDQLKAVLRSHNLLS